MPDIIHRIGIKASASRVHEAVSTLEGLASWWTEDVKGESRMGGRIEFDFRTPAGVLIGSMAMEVEKTESPREVRWRVLEGPPDWVGTGIDFRLSSEDGLTILLFGHRGWKEATESMAHCSMKWAVFLLSLREHAETGKGRPSPHDLKIDNWN